MTEPTEAPPTANADQRRHWNSADGLKWRTLADQIGRHLAGITERLLAHARPAPGERVLDVGCGTGETSLRLAAAVAPGAVLGVDLSEGLIEAARERARAAGRANLDFVLADAQVHGFEAGAFDLAASRFGVMFFDDPVAALRNLARALRPGGRLAFACWGPLAENPWFAVPRAAALRHLGPPAPQPANAPGPLAFADAAYVEGLLAAAGLEAIRIGAEAVTLEGGDSLEETARFSCRLGPAARRIGEAEAAPETVEKIAAEIAEGFRRYLDDGRLKVPAAVNFITARRPGSV